MSRYTLFLCFIFLFTLTLNAQSESDYADQVNQYYFQGKREVSVYGGRIDILNEEYAIEVERAHKWKEAIGQALWYGQQKKLKPGIVLLVLEPKDYKYFQMLNSTLNYAGMADKIMVWEYPRDFVAVLPEDGW